MLTVGPSSIRFEVVGSDAVGLASASVELPLPGLVVELGGAGNRIVFFSHPACEAWSVTTADTDVLRAPELADVAAVRAALGRHRRRGALMTGLLVGVLVAFLVSLGGIVLMRGRIVAAAAAAVPVSVEKTIGEAAIASMKDVQFLESPELAESLDALTGPLVRALPEQRYAFTFRLADDATINAFALPGGSVVVHSGLLLRAERAEEVLGVLAHEIAHVQERHGIRSMISQLGLVVIVQAFFGDASGLAAIVAEGGRHLAGLQFSRDFEREADDRAVEYLVAAGMSVDGMLTFFEKMRDEEARAGHGAPSLSLLSTHPATAERIERLGVAVRAAPQAPAFNFDYEAFREQVRAAATTDASGDPE